jgi:2-oxoglutarate decarboxylase
VAESSSAQSRGGSSSVDNPLAAFGANEWLVEEMYERYKQDPNSVDKAWWDFFKNYHAGDAEGGAAP